MKHLPIIFLLSILLLLGCRTHTEQTIDRVTIEKTDTVNSVQIRIDSIVIRDSVVRIEKGDSVFIEKWHTAYRDRLRVDTVYQVQTETVYQTRTETKTEYVNHLYWWQTLLMWLGVLASVFGIAFLWSKFR